MDLIFLLTTLVFLFFILVAFYLNIIKYSSPLILIYIVFCFSYIINQDSVLTQTNEVLDNQESIKSNDLIVEKVPSNEFKSTSNEDIKSNIMDKRTIEVSKPIVSFNPKPIVIDSNLIIQKDKERVNQLLTPSTKDIKQTEKENISTLNTLKLNEIMICRGVYKRNPIKPGFNFTNNVDSLFCYTKISNSGPKQEIKHVWYYEEKFITSVVYNIKTSYNYRSWSKKTIIPSQTGKWRVDIVDNKENVLGSRNFEIFALNESY